MSFLIKREVCFVINSCKVLCVQITTQKENRSKLFHSPSQGNPPSGRCQEARTGRKLLDKALCALRPALAVLSLGAMQDAEVRVTSQSCWVLSCAQNASRLHISRQQKYHWPALQVSICYFPTKVDSQLPKNLALIHTIHNTIELKPCVFFNHCIPSKSTEQRNRIISSHNDNNNVILHIFLCSSINNNKKCCLEYLKRKTNLC